MSGAVEIEIDSPDNHDLYFEPTQCKVRGRFLAQRVKLESAGGLAMALPAGLPGCRVRIDPAKGEGQIIEPLAAPESAPLRDAIGKLLSRSDLSYGEPFRTYPGAHAPTWLGWMLRAVQAGLARVVAGKLPDAVPADCKPRAYSGAGQPDPRDALIADLTRRLSALEAKK